MSAISLFFSNNPGWCILDLPALILMAVLVIVLVLHHYGPEYGEEYFEKHPAGKRAGRTDKTE